MALIHFILNPLRPSIGLKWPYEEKKIEALTTDFEVHITRGRLHAEIITRDAIEAGAKLIVSVAGDSTLSEIANGIYRAREVGQMGTRLTVHPELQKGDAIKSMSVRKSFTEFLEAFLKDEAIEDDLDLGEVEFTGEYGQKVRRLFVNCGGFGFSASLVSRLRREAAPSRFQFLRLVSQLIPFFRFQELNIIADDQKIFSEEEILLGLIHNGIFGGHGIKLSPQSSLSDGKLEYTIIRRTFTYKYLLGIFPLFAGKLKSASIVHQGVCEKMKVEACQPVRKLKVDFDGDAWGFLPANFKILPKALPIYR